MAVVRVIVKGSCNFPAAGKAEMVADFDSPRAASELPGGGRSRTVHR